jgi:light-regulated signal transduction histidine kinase (bacteriophytochrome)
LCDDYSETLDEIGREYAARIVTSAQRMERLIQDLLNYGRLSHIDVTFEPVELEKAVDATLLALEQEIARQKAIIRVERPLPCVRANRAMMEDVFQHLISNALKFVAPGIFPIIQISAEQIGEKIRVYVKDNGIGVDREYHEKIFRVFEKVHGSASEHATGIGLAIVRKSLERLGGQVGIDSKPGRGSIFWFELPQAKQEPKNNS